MFNILDAEPDPPSKWKPELPKAFDETIMKALVKRKEDRHEYAVNFKRELLTLARQ